MTWLISFGIVVAVAVAIYGMIHIPTKILMVISIALAVFTATTIIHESIPAKKEYETIVWVKDTPRFGIEYFSNSTRPRLTVINDDGIHEVVGTFTGIASAEKFVDAFTRSMRELDIDVSEGTK